MVGPLSLFPCRLAFVSDHSICWRITGSYILFLVVPSDVCSYYFSSCKRFLAVLFLSSVGSMFTRASTSAVILPRDMQVQLLLLSSWISQEFYPVVWWMNWTCWDLINGKLLWLALRSVENELNIFCTSQILSFTRAGILSYMPKCVYVADLIYWIYSLCLEGWRGLLLAAVAAAEQQQAAQPEAAAQQQQRVGRRQMLSGIGTLRGERTPGVWRAQGGGKPRGLIPGIPN